jgi:ubiquinone/menaquinone biosynthesis C-methylase UbiE
MKTVYDFLIPTSSYKKEEGYIKFDIDKTEAIDSNAYYFNHPEWAQEYLIYCHRDVCFKDRWKYATGIWTNKIVVDIGCGPGNIHANLQENPELLIGIDVAPASLLLAAKQGYVAVLADAHKLPFVSEFADIVVLNAALHHCENMETVLKEASRLVKPGGFLITDHDPQWSAWNYKGIAKLLWNLRLHVYKWIGHSFHKDDAQQKWALKSEIHHKPGDGVTKKLFYDILSPQGFEVNVFPHNHTEGRSIFKGIVGKASLQYRVGNILSGRNPFAKESALTLMCVAQKKFFK